MNSNSTYADASLHDSWRRDCVKLGYFSSLDGGCTWTDGGVLPDFDTRADRVETKKRQI